METMVTNRSTLRSLLPTHGHLLHQLRDLESACVHGMCGRTTALFVLLFVTQHWGDHNSKTIRALFRELHQFSSECFHDDADFQNSLPTCKLLTILSSLWILHPLLSCQQIKITGFVGSKKTLLRSEPLGSAVKRKLRGKVEEKRIQRTFSASY